MAEAAYHEPETLDGALKLLGATEGARCLAGGQTLVAMLNARLVDPPVLVGLRRIKELAGIARQADGSLRIGAMATHEAVAANPETRSGFPLVAETAEAIAHPPIRAFGTIGGAIAHGDPASDYPAALVASDASIELASAKGRRLVKSAEFFQDYLTTALAPGEIVTAAIVPKPASGARDTFLKYARVDGDYATISVAAILALDGGNCRHVAVALGAAGPTPVRASAAEAAWIGRPFGAEAIAALGKALAEAADPVDDVRGSSAYRRAVIPGLVARALAALKS